MAYEVRWSLPALDDLKNIAEYISKDSPVQATLIVEKFIELVPGYGLRPRAATIVPELGQDNFRHKSVYNWRVIYEINDLDKTVVIHAILHGKRLFSEISSRIK